MDNFKYLTAFGCDDLNENDATVSVDLIVVCETLRKKLFRSLKIAKKFKEELKLANLEKYELIVRLDESNKKNEFLRNQFSSQDEKMKSLEQKLGGSKAKLENFSNTKLLVDNRSVFVHFKPKTNKVYVSPFKKNHKEKFYVTRLDKGKSSNVGTEVSKPLSKPFSQLWNKSIFVPTCHLCGVVGHIRSNCYLLRHKPKLETRSASRNTDVPKYIPVCHFCGIHDHIRPNCHKLKFKHSAFQSMICDDISPAISPNKLFHMVLKNLSLLV